MVLGILVSKWSLVRISAADCRLFFKCFVEINLSAPSLGSHIELKAALMHLVDDTKGSDLYCFRPQNMHIHLNKTCAPKC